MAVEQAKVDEVMGRLIQDFAGATGSAWHEHSPGHWEGTDQATSAFIGADLPADRAGPSRPRPPLREAISTGTSCAYAPAAPVDWEL